MNRSQSTLAGLVLAFALDASAAMPDLAAAMKMNPNLSEPRILESIARECREFSARDG